MMYENGTIGSDGKYDCSFSVPDRFTVSQSTIVEKYSDPTDSNKFDEEANNEYHYQNCTSEEHLCSCPTQQKWTRDQPAVHRETNKFSGGVH